MVAQGCAGKPRKPRKPQPQRAAGVASGHARRGHSAARGQRRAQRVRAQHRRVRSPVEPGEGAASGGRARGR
jgi:hypothetical protein